MTGDTVQYQGEGTYTYNCEYPDCWYCGLMKIKSTGSEKRRYYLDKYFDKKKNNYWTQGEIRTLYSLRDKHIKDLVDLFPLRTRHAIFNKRWEINKKIKETKIPLYYY